MNGGATSCCTAGCTVRPAGEVCRVVVGACDIAETCDGLLESCPADGFSPAGDECRTSRGSCDPAERCTGTTPECPADASVSDGTACDTGSPCALEQCVDGECVTADACLGVDVGGTPVDGIVIGKGAATSINVGLADIEGTGASSLEAVGYAGANPGVRVVDGRTGALVSAGVQVTKRTVRPLKERTGFRRTLRLRLNARGKLLLKSTGELRVRVLVRVFDRRGRSADFEFPRTWRR